MFDWIIEADIYRLNKEALEASSQQERRELEELAELKVQLLAARQRVCSELSGS